MLKHVAAAHYALFRNHVEHLMGMSGDNVYLVATDEIEELVGVCGVVVDLETVSLVGLEHLGMHRDDKRSRLADVCEVFGKPRQLVGRNALGIVASGLSVSSVVVCAVDVVKHYVMHLSDVE